MHGGLNAVVLLNIKFGESIVLISRGIADITESRSINDVSKIIILLRMLGIYYR